MRRLFVGLLLLSAPVFAQNSVTLTERTQVTLLRGTTAVTGSPFASWDVCLARARELARADTRTSGTVQYRCQTERRDVIAAYAPAPVVPPPPPPPEASNPDGIPTGASLYRNDYNAQRSGDVYNGFTEHGPYGPQFSWSATGGHGGTGAWTATANPLPGSTEYEDSAGWVGPSWNVPGTQPLVVLAWKQRMSSAMVNEIGRRGQFWNHVNKAIDFKYRTSSGGEGNRNGFHFGSWQTTAVGWVFSTGGGGQFLRIGPDFRTLGDRWVCHYAVIDMRATTASGRYLALYLQPEGQALTRVGIAYENGSTPLQPYNGAGIGMLFSPLFGYWDDHNGREGVQAPLNTMTLTLDDVGIYSGWPSSDLAPRC